MYKINRAYVGNFGYRDAWYDGLTVDFRSTLTGEPTHTILKAPNGTGKTSLLGFVFSCFEPQIKRFLPHLNDPSRHFHHYFDGHGLPGIALIEFLLPRHTGQEGKRLVVGQACAMHAGQPSRIFFSFEESEGLSFEQVPGPKLRADGRVSRSIDDFSRWAQEMRSRYPGNFQPFESQAKWQDHLDRERGLDPYLFRVQLELSRREGAVDEGLLRFGSESDFLKMFFGMVLSEERGMKVREAVALACQKLKDYPRYEKQLAELGSLSNMLLPFAREADGLAAANARVAKLTADARAMAASLQVLKERFEGAREQEEQLAKTKGKEAEQRRKASEAAGGAVEALEAEKLERAARRARDAESLALKASNDAEKAIQYLDAAQLLERIEEAADRIRRVTRQITEEGQGLADFEREARETGAVFRYALALAESEARSSAGRHHEKATIALGEANRLDEENLKLQGELLGLERKRSALQQVQNQFEQGLAGLGNEGLVNRAVGERAADAISRHSQAVAAARSDRTRFEQEAQSRRAHGQKLAGELAGVREGLGQLRAQQQVKDELFENGVAKRDELSELPVLCQAAGNAERIDPESASTMLALESFLARLALEISRINIRSAELDADDKSLEISDLASAGADVETVVAKLKELGVASAKPFAHYIAKVEPEASRARAMVLSNPGRYLGVAVASEDDLATARSIAGQPPTLSRPIVVSLYSDQPDTQTAGHVVVPAASDAVYNFEAAEAFAKRLKKESTELAGRAEQLSRLQREGLRAKQVLEDYLAQYGDGKLAGIRAEVDRLAGEIRAAEVQAEALNGQIQSATNEAERLDGLAREKAAETERLAAWLARLREFEKQFEATEPERRTEIAALTRRITAIEQQRASNSTGAEAARRLGNGELVKVEQFTQEAQGYGVERSGVILDHEDEKRAAEGYRNDSQTLTVYRDRYQQARRAYDTAVENRLGRLKADLDHAEADHRRYEGDYRNKFPDKDDFLAEAKCLIGADYKTEMARRRSVKESKAAAHVRASTDRALAEDAQRKHHGGRKYSGAVFEGSAEMSDGVLEEKIAAKTQTRDKADEDARLASNAAAEARQRAMNNGHCVNDIGRARGGLLAILGSDQIGEPDDSLLGKGIALVEDAQPLSQSVNEARGEATAAERKSRQAYARVDKVARSDSFAHALPALAAQFSRNTFETACDDRTGLTEAIGQQIAATKSARDAVQADFDACLSELQGFCNDALDALKAATRKRLPDSVPHYGGKEVLLMKSIAATMTAEVRRGMLEGYLKNLIADNRIPENGAQLAADAVVTLHGGQPLGLKLIRVTQHQRLEYDEISKISSSGGEKVTAAMLLYFVVVKLRAENRAKRADGGPLILDNPFAKMNMESLWRAIRSLADAVGVQCIFATIIEDKNALSVFDKLIELRAGPVNRRTDRRHVEAVDVTFKAPIAA